jgi:hypothetical protein
LNPNRNRSSETAVNDAKLASFVLDLLTIALISGTSVAMIQKHYGHLRQDHAEQALKTLNLMI